MSDYVLHEGVNINAEHLAGASEIARNAAIKSARDAEILIIRKPVVLIKTDDNGNRIEFYGSKGIVDFTPVTVTGVVINGRETSLKDEIVVNFVGPFQSSSLSDLFTLTPPKINASDPKPDSANALDAAYKELMLPKVNEEKVTPTPKTPENPVPAQQNQLPPKESREVSIKVTGEEIDLAKIVKTLNTREAPLFKFSSPIKAEDGNLTYYHFDGKNITNFAVVNEFDNSLERLPPAYMNYSISVNKQNGNVSVRKAETIHATQVFESDKIKSETIANFDSVVDFNKSLDQTMVDVNSISSMLGLAKGEMYFNYCSTKEVGHETHYNFDGKKPEKPNLNDKSSHSMTVILANETGKVHIKETNVNPDGTVFINDGLIRTFDSVEKFNEAVNIQLGKRLPNMGGAADILLKDPKIIRWEANAEPPTITNEFIDGSSFPLKPHELTPRDVNGEAQSVKPPK